MKNVETAEVHTRLLRLALGVDDSRAYWEHLDPAIPRGPRAIQAFEQRWFGSKSLERVRTLLGNFGARYDAFPEALDVLRSWKAMSPTTRQLICHWHLQLTDPLYREFTAGFLVRRRISSRPPFDRDVLIQWVREQAPGRWSPSTVVQFASKLLSAALGAGLSSSSRDPRVPQLPIVPPDALEYLLYLLRGVRFAGSLWENPYLASVGLTGDALDRALRTLPGLDYKRMGDLHEFGWKFEDLVSWAEERP